MGTKKKFIGHFFCTRCHFFCRMIRFFRAEVRFFFMTVIHLFPGGGPLLFVGPLVFQFVVHHWRTTIWGAPVTSPPATDKTGRAGVGLCPLPGDSGTRPSVPIICPEACFFAILCKIYNFQQNFMKFDTSTQIGRNFLSKAPFELKLHQSIEQSELRRFCIFLAPGSIV